MPHEIHAKKTEKYTYRDFFLLILIDFLANIKDNRSKRVSEESTNDKVSRYIIDYLKATHQHRKQFQLCLKMFDGKDEETLSKPFKRSTKKVFNNYLDSLIEELIKYSKRHVNENKIVDLNFEHFLKNNDTFNEILHKKFTEYGKNILDEHRNPSMCNKARINFSSPSTRKKVESKIRKIGKYASIHDALEFIEIRIGLFGKYKYKDLVDDLEELKNDFLIISENNEIKTSKKNKTTKELVQEAFKNYEVVNSPQYLIDQNTYKSALRNKIKTTLNRN